MGGLDDCENNVTHTCLDSEQLVRRRRLDEISSVQIVMELSIWGTTSTFMTQDEFIADLNVKANESVEALVATTLLHAIATSDHVLSNVTVKTVVILPYGPTSQPTAAPQPSDVSSAMASLIFLLGFAALSLPGGGAVV